MLICNIGILSLIFIALFLIAIDAKCNVCQSNGAACVNSTSFKMCFGNEVYHCKKGFVCSELNAICVQSLAMRPASCGDTSLCGLCSAHENHLFACTSRNTFRMCYGDSNVNSVLGYCPDGYVCNAKSNFVCVPFTRDVELTCDLLHPNESYLEDTTSTTTGVSVSSSDPIVATTDIPILETLTAQEVCDVEQKVGVFQIPGDTQCLEYVRCFMHRGQIMGSLTKCPTGTYFSGESLQCVLAKPSYCL